MVRIWVVGIEFEVRDRGKRGGIYGVDKPLGSGRGFGPLFLVGEGGGKNSFAAFSLEAMEGWYSEDRN